jgi:Protein of unknown function (DUF3433)
MFFNLSLFLMAIQSSTISQPCSALGACYVYLFYIIVLGLLIALIFFNNVSFNSRYGYFTIQILPPIIGTITASLWRAITTTLSRISPYISSASDISSANEGKHSARRKILARYFPIADIVDMIRNGDGILTATWILWVLSNTVLAFKAVLLETTDWDALGSSVNRRPPSPFPPFKFPCGVRRD